jgi:methylated-DNA-[protein]-cysteine S-methyltransferase
MNCERFDEIQLAALVGEAPAAARRDAAAHARACERCGPAAERDRALEQVLSAGRHGGTERGFSRARRRLHKSFDDRRASYARAEGPFGPVFLARTGEGLCRVSFRSGTEEDFAADLVSHDLLPEFEPRKLATEMRQLRDYFGGRITAFSIPVDLRLATPFQQRVLRTAARVPFGRVASYSDIARRIGQPGARRAVGTALGRNPVPIVIPCHRVVAGDGSIGGYMGGLEVKRTLMRIEGITLERTPRAHRG